MLGLKFTAAMLDGNSQAEEVPATRVDVGTTVTLFAKSTELFDQLHSKFSHWMRNVEGLRATHPSGRDGA